MAKKRESCRRLRMAFPCALMASLLGSGVSAEGDRLPELLAESARAVARGEFEAAGQASTKALNLADDSGDPRARALARLAAAEASIGRREFASADAALSLALSLFMELGDRAGEARVRAARAQIFAASGEISEALAELELASEASRESGDELLVVQVQANAARTSLDHGHRAQALRYCSEAERNLRGLDHPSVPLLQAHLGRTLQLLSRADDPPDPSLRLRAYALLVGAASAAQNAQDSRVAAFAHGWIGALYEDEGRDEEALRHTRRAVFHGQRSGSRDVLQRFERQMGRLLARVGEMEEAVAAYERSIALATSLRHRRHGYAALVGDFHSTSGAVYYELADLLLRQAASTPRAADKMLRAREVIEEMKGLELRDYFGDECVDAAQAPSRSLDVVSGDSLIVYPLALEERLELLVARAGRIRRYEVDVGRQALAREVEKLRARIERPVARLYLRPASKLYDWLVRPYEEQIDETVRTIVFVPDGPVRSIPVGALFDGEKFLVEKVALGVSPSLWLTEPRPLDRKAIRLVAGGLSEPVGGFSALPHVREELADLSESFGAEVLLDARFRIEDFSKRVASHPWSVVHIATHARFEDDPKDSFLLAYDGRLEMDKLSDLVGEFEAHTEPLELLTLSACETAAGSDRAALGLAGAAVKAGARSVLGTLWQVNDRAAAQVVRAFYKALSEPGVSRAEALRRAQLQLLAEPRTRHPSFWSAFLIISNWM